MGYVRVANLCCCILQEGILHDELKRRGQETSEQKFTSASISTAQRQLDHNVGAYNARCHTVKVCGLFWCFCYLGDYIVVLLSCSWKDWRNLQPMK